MVDDLHLLGVELIREIAVTQEALALKISQLNEARKKLRKESIDHQMVKNTLQNTIKEVNDLKNKLDVSALANSKLEEENSRLRELTAKLQTQMDAYIIEKQFLLDRCNNNDFELCNLKNQIEELQDQLQESIVHKEHFIQYQRQMKNLLDQVISKQEILQREQTDLEKTFHEGMLLASNLSEKLAIQNKFVKEANFTTEKLEKELLQLIGVLEGERKEKKRLLQTLSTREIEHNYLVDWKSSQEQTSLRIRYLTEENKKLQDEVELLKAELDLVMHNDKKTMENFDKSDDDIEIDDNV